MFNETFKTAVLSTAHLTSETLNLLDVLEQNRDLPYWVHPTDYGFIFRFNAVADREGSKSNNDLSTRPDVLAVYEALQAASIDAALFDSDGPMIDGLTDYSEGHL